MNSSLWWAVEHLYMFPESFLSISWSYSTSSCRWENTAGSVFPSAAKRCSPRADQTRQGEILLQKHCRRSPKWVGATGCRSWVNVAEKARSLRTKWKWSNAFLAAWRLESRQMQKCLMVLQEEVTYSLYSSPYSFGGYTSLFFKSSQAYCSCEDASMRSNSEPTPH